MPAPAAKPRWTRAATVGLVLAACAPVLSFLVGAVFGLDLGDAVVFLVPPMVIGFLAAFLVARFGTWAKVVGLIATLILTGLLFFFLLGITLVSSFFDFLIAIVSAAGLALAWVGGVGSLVASRRGSLATRAEGGERTAIRVALATVAALALLSGILHLTSRKAVDASAALTIRAEDFSWEQDSYSVAGGSRIVVRNTDPFFHTFTVDALSIDQSILPGSAYEVTIPAKPGSYVLYCRPHTSNSEDPGDEDMAATLVVT